MSQIPIPKNGKSLLRYLGKAILDPRDPCTDKSVVAVALENTGNVRLRPVAEFVLLDAAGFEVSRASVPMDTFYAHTDRSSRCLSRRSSSPARTASG